MASIGWLPAQFREQRRSLRCFDLLKSKHHQEETIGPFDVVDLADE